MTPGGMSRRTVAKGVMGAMGLGATVFSTAACAQSSGGRSWRGDFYEHSPGDPLIQRVAGGHPAEMAIDARGRTLAVAYFGQPLPDLEVIDLGTGARVHQIGSRVGDIVNYGDGFGQGTMTFSRDQTRLLWIEMKYRPETSVLDCWVRQLDLTTGVTEVLAQLVIDRTFMMATDTPIGLLIGRQLELTKVEAGQASTVTVPDMPEPGNPIILGDGDEALLIAGRSSGIALCRFGSAGFEKPVDLSVEGHSLIAAALTGQHLWVVTAGRSAARENEPVNMTFQLDINTLALISAHAFDNTLVSPTSMTAGPNGVFMGTLHAGAYKFAADGSSPVRINAPDYTGQIVDTETGLYGRTSRGVWRIAPEDLARVG